MKKVLTSIFILILIMSVSISVYAATGSINVGASSEVVTKGNTFTVSITGLSDTNIIGMKANMAYDQEKLELVSRKAGDNFTDGSANNSEIAIATGGVGDKSVTLAVYTFKVKDNAPEGTADIKISNIVLAADTDINISDDKTVTVTIKADNTTVGGNQNDEDQNGGNQNGGNTEGTPSSGDRGSDPVDGSNDDSNKDDTKEEVKKPSKTTTTTKKTTTKKTTTKLPQTGIESISIFAMIVLAGTSITSYIAYKKYKNI